MKTETIKDAAGKVVARVEFDPSSAMTTESIQFLRPCVGDFLRLNGKRWKCINTIRAPCDMHGNVMKTQSKWECIGRDYRKRNGREDAE